MQKMMQLRDMLEDELNRITSQNKMTQQILDMVDKLTHSIKSIDTIIAMEESKYSNRGSYGSYRGSYDGSYDGSYNDGSYEGSYDRDRRGRNADGSYRTRMDGGRDQRYSRDLKTELHHLMKDAKPEEKMMIEDWMRQL